MHTSPWKEQPGMNRARFDEHDKGTLGNYLRVAAERFKEHADTFRKLIDHKPGPDDIMQISGDAARSMAEQFERQRAEAVQYAEVFENSQQILDILYEGDEE